MYIQKLYYFINHTTKLFYKIMIDTITRFYVLKFINQ